MKIQHNGKDWSLNIDRAIELGVLKEKINIKDGVIQVGDVFVCPLNKTNPFLLVKPLYHSEDNKDYALLGMGCSPNSGEFFHSLHTLGEIEEYLADYKMVFKKNIDTYITNNVN